MSVPITARVPVKFPPPALSETKPLVKIHCRVPTMYDRDTYGTLLIANGWVIYSRRQIRDLCLAGVEFILPPEDHAEAFALLEELWAERDAQDKAQALQLERLKELMSMPEFPDWTKDMVTAELAKITADVVMPVERKVKASGIQNQVMGNYDPLMKALASQTAQDQRRYWITIEHYVQGWEGIEHEPDGNGNGGITRHEAEYLRSELGEKAWEQLGEFINAMMELDSSDQKNLDLLLASMSARTGSKPTGDSKESSAHGNSTDESGIPIPEEESPKTIESSSSSTTSSPKKTEPSEPGQTAEH